MIVIAIGANLPGPAGTPLQNCEAALAALSSRGVRVRQRSRWYRSPPWPAAAQSSSGHEAQPWYVNGAAIIETMLDPAGLLALLHDVEARFGRIRDPATRNAPRTLDLDLIDYNGVIRAAAPVLPHPRAAERAFVLRPLAEIAPNWRHPESGRSVKDLLDALPADSIAEPLQTGPESSPDQAKTH
ncbi:MAG TPA: 2-amino-4-hydroxy-6-hydroxymethyldihydropteridine diphosphokinase [Alphaproteobacteria bacterium]